MTIQNLIEEYKKSNRNGIFVLKKMKSLEKLLEKMKFQIAMEYT